MTHTHYYWPVYFGWSFGGDTRLVFGAAPPKDGPTYYLCKCGEQGYAL